MYFFKKKKKKNQKDSQGATALHWAAGEGHVDIVKTLIEKGADVQAKDSNKESPLHYA